MTTPATFLHAPSAAFRGSRGYVHSTDLYEEILRGTAAAGLSFDGPVNLRIRQRMTRVPRYELLQGGGDAPAEFAALCHFSAGGAEWTWVVTETQQDVSDRKPYDESPASSCGRFSDRAVTISEETGLRPIEAVTALAVLLLNRELPPAAGQRWMLGQLALDRALRASDTRLLTIAIERKVGATMVRCAIVGEDGPFGSMMFILA